MELHPTVKEVAAALGETEEGPTAQLLRLFEVVGDQGLRELLASTEEVEANGGMLVPDGSRRRSRGGVFFTLARQRLSRKDRKKVFAWQGSGEPAEGQEARPPSSRPDLGPPRPVILPLPPRNLKREVRVPEVEVIRARGRALEPVASPEPPAIQDHQVEFRFVRSKEEPDQATASSAGEEPAGRATGAQPPRRRIVVRAPEPEPGPPPPVASRGRRRVVTPAAEQEASSERDLTPPESPRAPAPSAVDLEALSLEVLERRVAPLVAAFVSELRPLLERLFTEQVHARLGGPPRRRRR